MQKNLPLSKIILYIIGMNKLSLILAFALVLAASSFAQKKYSAGECSEYEYRENSSERHGVELYRNGVRCEFASSGSGGVGDKIGEQDLCQVEPACNIRHAEDYDKVKGHKEGYKKWRERNNKKDK